MSDDVDRIPCSDIVCGRDGHQRCREAGPKTLGQHLWDLSYEMAREAREGLRDE